MNVYRCVCDVCACISVFRCVCVQALACVRVCTYGGFVGVSVQNGVREYWAVDLFQRRVWIQTGPAALYSPTNLFIDAWLWVLPRSASPPRWESPPALHSPSPSVPLFGQSLFCWTLIVPSFMFCICLLGLYPPRLTLYNSQLYSAIENWLLILSDQLVSSCLSAEITPNGVSVECGYHLLCN